MIAIALSCQPSILIADEPTTALDVTIQAQILDLLMELKNKLDTAIILVTHDLGLWPTWQIAFKLCTPGRFWSGAPLRRSSTIPSIPYTWALLSSVPKLAAHAKQGTVFLKGTPP